MASGFKIADAFVEVHLDRDPARAELVGLPSMLDADAEKAGKDVGKKLGDGIGKGIGDAPVSAPSTKKGTEAGGKFGDAFSSKVKAALASLPPVDLDLKDEAAQAKLQWLHDELAGLSSQRVGIDISDTEAIAKLTAIRAELDNLAARSPSVQVDADTRAAAAEIDKFLVTTEAKAEVAGKAVGDKMSKGMQDATSKASPLIVAAVAGGLIAGAPAITAAAGVAFIGIAAAAVHSNQQVQQAFSTTKDAITTTFTNAAQVTVPSFVSALQRIGSAVQGLGPQLHTAFAALSGPIDSLTTGLIRMTQNVMPGLVSAVKSSGPVFQGLADLMASVGKGIGDMFQIVSEHSSSAGQVFSSLGKIIGDLLPIIGRLVGAGADLAANILPPIASALHLVGDALGYVSPLLAPVLAGFIGFKAVTSLTGPLGTLSAKLQTVAADAGTMGTKLAGTAASGVSKIGNALPAVGIGVALVGTAMQMANQSIQEWGRALLDGGNAAAQATTQINGVVSKLKEMNPAAQGGLMPFANALGVGTNAMKSAKNAADDLYKAMSPLEQKQQDVTQATNELEKAVETWGPKSGQAAGASVDLRDKQEALKRAQDDLMQATHGVTQAMMDQAAEALAAADSTFGYQRAQMQAHDAEVALRDAIKQHGAASQEAQKATLDLDEALLRQAEAAGKAAADQSGLTDKTELTKVSNQATLKSLLDLKAQYGSEFPAALQQTIDRLQAAGVKLDDVGSKKPTPVVDADITPAQRKVQQASGELNDLAAKRPVTIADLNPGPLFANSGQALANIANLGNQRPTPVANLTTSPLLGGYSVAMGNLGVLASQRPTPVASLIDHASGVAGVIQSWIAGIRDKTVTITTRHIDVSGGGNAQRAVATGGNIGKVVAGAKRFDIGGKISGPGGPTDDLVPAVTLEGIPLRVSNQEWIIKGSSAAKYGERAMAAINAGTATVSVSGGSSQGGTTRGGVTVQNLNVTVSGTLDFSDPSSTRKVAVGIRDALVRLEREQR